MKKRKVGVGVGSASGGYGQGDVWTPHRVRIRAGIGIGVERRVKAGSPFSMLVMAVVPTLYVTLTCGTGPSLLPGKPQEWSHFVCEIVVVRMRVMFFLLQIKKMLPLFWMRYFGG